MASREETKAYLKSINSTSLVEVFIKGDEVQFLTTLTLVYRAIPAPDGSASRFCIECLETARKTLREHHGITLLASTSYVKAIHVHW